MRWTWGVVCLVLGGCGTMSSPPVPYEGLVLDAATRRPVSQETVVQDLARADVVLLGERHDNPGHHALQATLFQALLKTKDVALAMEMIDQGQEAALADPDLGVALAWEARGWPSFAWYAPLLDAARAAGVPIVPANLPREAVRAVVRSQKASAPGLDRPLPPEVEASLVQELRESHCGMLPESALPGMALAQRVRDGVMAQAVADHAPAVLIAGWGHTRADRGVPWVLAALAPRLVVRSVAFVEVVPGLGLDDYAEGGPLNAPRHTYLWFTARAERDEGCPSL